MSDFFNFEDTTEDIPFYNGKPQLSPADWLILLSGIVLFVFILEVPVNIESNVQSVLFCLVLLLPVIYVTRGRLTLFFKKPKLKDLKVIILCLLGYYIYSLSAASLLTVLGVTTHANAVLSSEMNLAFWISVLIQLVGEELFRVIILILIMALIYHFTKNRKLSIYIGVIGVMFAFGIVHYGAYGSIIQILLIQGIGSIFEMFAYIKTKNVVVTYIIHVITDAIPFILVMILKMNNIAVPT